MRASKATPIPVEAPAIVSVDLGVGDWLDVLDTEGTWNVAQILSFPSDRTVEVAYDGWGDEFNEVVELNGGRVAPYHTYTWSVKVWAKYKNWPWWPAIATIRPPGTEAGRTYLMNEGRFFVDFLDKKLISKRCRIWIDRQMIRPFEEKFDERRKRTSGSDFEASLALCLQSTAVTTFPVLGKTGTLPAQYSTTIAEPVKQMKRAMGLRVWVGNFNTNRRRHRNVYVYKAPGDEDSGDDDDAAVVEFDSASDEDSTSKKPRAKTKTTVPAAQSKSLKSRRLERVSKKQAPIVNEVTDEERTRDTSRKPSSKRKAELPSGRDTKSLTSLKKQRADERESSTLQGQVATRRQRREATSRPPTTHLGGPDNTRPEPTAAGVAAVNEVATDGDGDADMASVEREEELIEVDDIESGSEDEGAAVFATPIDPLDDWETARSTGPNGA